MIKQHPLTRDRVAGFNTSFYPAKQPQAYCLFSEFSTQENALPMNTNPLWVCIHWHYALNPSSTDLRASAPTRVAWR